MSSHSHWIDIDASVRGKVKLAVFIADGLNCQPRNDALWDAIHQLVATYREKYPEPSAAREALRPARDLYRRIGIEPTKVRPSSEALLRRAIQGKPLYNINSIVDTCNYCSLSFLLPIGLYDHQKIRGRVVARLGQEGEAYPGIGKDIIHVAHRLTLVDEEGPFGNPSADSRRTAIDLHTTRILWVIYAPFEYPEDALRDHLHFSMEQLMRFHNGKIVGHQIIC
ncbi:MAG: hypothetical protein GXO78_02130 [Calditrichaeota bacterium]|nr:hypothetical protein [Calditrichota bacterium]